MIIMKKFLYIVALLLGVIYLSSCSQHEGTTIDGPAPYFKAYKLDVEVSESNAGVFTVDVNRMNPIGDVDVKVEATISDEYSKLFTTPVVASFKDGEYVAQVEFKFDFKELANLKKYKIDLAIKDEVVANSLAPLSIYVTKTLPYEVTKASFNSTFFGGEWDQDFLNITIGDTTYCRLPNLYEEGYKIDFKMDKGKTAILEFNKQQTGYVDSQYGMISVALIAQKTTETSVALGLNFTVSAGSFGSTWETLTYPAE